MDVERVHLFQRIAFFTPNDLPADFLQGSPQSIDGGVEPTDAKFRWRG